MKTRTLVVFSLAMGMVVACLGIAIADFNHVSEETLAGEVVFDAAPSGGMSVALKNISDNSAASQLSWTNVTLGQTEWKAANQYIKVTCDYNGTGWGIQIYTDNCATDADPKFYIDKPTDVNPAGLVATDNGKSVLPLAWRIMGETTSYARLGIQEVPDPKEPNMHHLESTDIPGKGYYPWLWMQDSSTPAISEKYTDAFVPGGDYVTIWRENEVHHAEGPGDYYASPSPNYVYIGARFTTATTPRTYRTSKLTLELFHE